jgi:uncharacterized linocin/CFP29 family protein
MNNLHRELAPVSAAAWASIEEEARRTFTLHLAGRRVTEVRGPGEGALAAVGTGHLGDITSPAPGVLAWSRTAQPVIELRVPFAVKRPMAFAEDRAVFEGYEAGGIAGIRESASNPALTLPADPRQYPDVISEALTGLRLAGVGGPYALLLSADAYTAVSETSDHGYPVKEHLSRLIDGQIIWAPAIDGAFVLTTRGGDFEMHLAQDLSIGYQSHDAESVHLYFIQALTFMVHTAEAAVPLTVG